MGVAGGGLIAILESNWIDRQSSEFNMKTLKEIFIQRLRRVLKSIFYNVATSELLFYFLEKKKKKSVPKFKIGKRQNKLLWSTKLGMQHDRTWIA